MVGACGEMKLLTLWQPEKKERKKKELRVQYPLKGMPPMT
jgi:hypothetical protein